jgi:hypothetical protein
MVLVISFSIYRWLQQDSDASFTWFIFAFIDPPVFFIEMIIEKWINAVHSMFFLPFVLYSVLGSLEYFGLGWIIISFINRIKGSKET